MADEPRVHQPVVRWYVRAGLEQREEDGRRSIRDHRQRYVAQCLERAGTALRIPGHWLAVLPQVERAPGRVVEHTLLVIARPVRMARDIRRKGGGVLHHLEQLGTYRVGCGLDRSQPGELLARVELDLWQCGEVVVARLLHEDAFLAEDDVQGLRKPRARPDRIETPRGELSAEIALVLRCVL